MVEPSEVNVVGGCARTLGGISRDFRVSASSSMSADASVLSCALVWGPSSSSSSLFFSAVQNSGILPSSAALEISSWENGGPTTI